MDSYGETDGSGIGAGLRHEATQTRQPLFALATVASYMAELKERSDLCSATIWIGKDLVVVVAIEEPYAAEEGILPSAIIAKGDLGWQLQKNGGATSSGLKGEPRMPPIDDMEVIWFQIPPRTGNLGSVAALVQQYSANFLLEGKFGKVPNSA
jgi:hypothetical protein